MRIARDGKLIYANEGALVQLADWKLELGKPAPRVLNDLIREVFTTGATKRVETTSGERIFTLSIQATPTQKDVNLYGIDITEIKRAEEKTLYQAYLLEQVNDAVVGSDSEMRLIAWNRAAERIYGWKPEEVLGRNTTEVMRTEWAEGDIKEMIKMIEVQGQWRGEATHIKKDGNRIPVELSTKVLREANGKLTGYVTVARDISARKQAEEQLIEYSEHLKEMVAERTRQLQAAQEQLVRKEKLAMLGALAAGMAHELRNPLGVISSSVYYLSLVQPDANEKIKQHLAMIEHEIYNATRIIGDLLDYARVIKTDPNTVFVRELVDHTLSRFPVPTSVRVSIKIPADLPQVYADPLHVEQILGNLITNGCQAMSTPSLNTNAGLATLSGGGKLTITARMKKQMLAIAVKDTGTGVTPENMEKLFEPLFSTKVIGIGLGLAVSKKLAEANGGRIEVESEVGKGSAFTLYLPLKAEK
jgi:PAS domain S-box-containing protein